MESWISESLTFEETRVRPGGLVVRAAGCGAMFHVSTICMLGVFADVAGAIEGWRRRG